MNLYSCTVLLWWWPMQAVWEPWVSIQTLPNSATAKFELGTALPQLVLFIPQYTIVEKFLISGDIGKSFLKFESAGFIVVNLKLSQREISGAGSPTGQMLPFKGKSSVPGNFFLQLNNTSLPGKKKSAVKYVPLWEILPCQGNPSL